jgi:predicted esterase
MVPLGQQLARAFSAARLVSVVSVVSPFASDISAGRQWFSVVGVTEDNRGARVDAAMPVFVETVRHWQRQSGVDAGATTLASFSQGAIMALEARKQTPPPAGCVLAFAGCYTTLPGHAPAARLHLLHGDEDRLMPVALAHADAAQRRRLGADHCSRTDVTATRRSSRFAIHRVGGCSAQIPAVEPTQARTSGLGRYGEICIATPMCTSPLCACCMTRAWLIQCQRGIRPGWPTRIWT